MKQDPKLEPPLPSPFAQAVLADVAEQKPELLRNEQYSVQRNSEITDVPKANELHGAVLPSKATAPRMAAAASAIRAVHVLKRGRVNIGTTQQHTASFVLFFF